MRPQLSIAVPKLAKPHPDTLKQVQPFMNLFLALAVSTIALCSISAVVVASFALNLHNDFREVAEDRRRTIKDGWKRVKGSFEGVKTASARSTLCVHRRPCTGATSAQENINPIGPRPSSEALRGATPSHARTNLPPPASAVTKGVVPHSAAYLFYAWRMSCKRRAIPTALRAANL